MSIALCAMGGRRMPGGGRATGSFRMALNAPGSDHTARSRAFIRQTTTRVSSYARNATNTRRQSTPTGREGHTRLQLAGSSSSGRVASSIRTAVRPEQTGVSWRCHACRKAADHDHQRARSRLSARIRDHTLRDDLRYARLLPGPRVWRNTSELFGKLPERAVSARAPWSE